ncbi:armadillo-type protein, partial [Thamnocephalis sphaerospora]
MGNQVSSMTPSTVTAGIASYVAELEDVDYEKSMGNARFLKTIRGRTGSSSSALVVKIFVKPDLTWALNAFVSKAKEENSLVINVPNAAPYVRVHETDRAVYLVRPFIASNLYDRISTRPFLAPIEKKWIAYQLCRAVRDAHAREICHGDIKTENVLVTSWNWAYLSDFASFKPTFVPEDNPADFSYYFDISGRRVCYLAPERFLAAQDVSGRTQIAKLSPAMDVFSLGCVIAELYLEGTAIFTLSQLLRYRRQEYDPSPDLDKIEDEDIRALVKHMIQLDASARLSVAAYLEEHRGRTFPEYFYSSLYDTMADMVEADSEHSGITSIYEDDRPPVATGDVADRRILALHRAYTGLAAQLSAGAKEDIGNVHSDIVRLMSVTTEQQRQQQKCEYLLYLPLLCSSIKHARRTSSKLLGLDLMLETSRKIDEDHVLDRVLPYLIWILADTSALVRGRSVEVIAKMLSGIRSLTRINTDVFPEYILPQLAQCLSDSDSYVRRTYAKYFPSLLETADRFFELGQAAKRNRTTAQHNGDEMLLNNNGEPSYDMALAALQQQLNDHTDMLLVSQDSSVRRALLGGIARLCVAFGRQRANDRLVAHIVTYMNDGDWMLSCSLLEAIVGVATFVGGKSLEEYMLPVLVQGLVDPEEYVVEKALTTMTSLASMGLFQKATLRELAVKVAPLMCHPNHWIRCGAVSFILSCVRLLTQPDFWCILYPIVRPLLQSDVAMLDEEHLMSMLKAPLSRALFDLALAWAGKSPSFLETISRSGNVGARSNRELSRAALTAPDVLPCAGIHALLRDDQYMEKLQHLGMTLEVEEKLAAMGDYIVKLAASKQRWAVKAQTTLERERPSQLQEKQVEPESSVYVDARQLPSPLRLAHAYSHLAIPPPLERNLESLRGLMQASWKETMSPKAEAQIALDSVSAKATIEMPMQDSLVDSISVADFSLDDMGAPSIFSNADLDLDVDHRSSAPNDQSATAPGMSDSANSVRTSRMLIGTVSTEGTVESMKSLLEKKAREAFPDPLTPADLGPLLTTSLLARHRAAMRTAAQHRNSHGWRPSGMLVAHLAEHKGAVNQICLAPDHAFFATASDDGTVKLWDCSRLGRHLNNKSRVTYNKLGGPVKCMTFIEGRHCIAAASANGRIHVFRIDYQGSSSSPRYGRCHTVYDMKLEGEHAVQIEHYENDAASMLVYATSKGVLRGIDLRTMKVEWTFAPPPSHGALTAFVIDHRRTWMLSGSSRGVLTLWDLRFRIPLRSWMHPRRERIHRMVMHAGPKSRGRIVAVSAGRNEVSIWDVERMQCTDVF